MNNQTLISLPSERAAMLRDIAKRLDMPITSVIGDMILRHVERGVIEDATAGVDIVPIGRDVKFRVEARDGAAIALTLNAVQAWSLADLIDALTVRPGGHKITAGGETIELAKIGTSIRLSQNGHRRHFAYAVAKDVARQLRKAVRRIEQTSGPTAK